MAEELNIQLVTQNDKKPVNVKTIAKLVSNEKGETLEKVEAKAQENKIEKITLAGVELQILDKTVNIDSYTTAEADAKFLTEHQDISNLATKAEVTAIPKFATEVVDELPTEGQNATVYLVRATDNEEDNLYAEYIYVNGAFEKLGEQKLDISGKQDNLTEEQLAAVNSGITAALVEKFNAYEALIAGKTTMAEVEAKGYLVAADIENLQEQLTTEQLAAVNSGITVEKVAKYDGYETEIAGKTTMSEVTSTIEGLNLLSYVEIV